MKLKATISSKLRLNQAYPFENRETKRIRDALVFSVFVFLFLFVFQPFQIGNFKEHTLAVSAGYGMVCLLLMLILNVAIVRWSPNYFDEKNWTTGRQIFWTLTNVFLIGMGNFLYSHQIGVVSFSWNGLAKFQFFTIAVGAFPLVISVLYNQSRLQTKYAQSSDSLNATITETALNQEGNQALKTEQKITIPSQYTQENLSLFPDDLLFIRSADNYIEVFFMNGNTVEKHLLRNTLKSTESILTDTNFFRCHKSFLVNLTHVSHISGNAQGYKLHLSATDDVIPVSRSNNDFLKSYFDKRP